MKAKQTALGSYYDLLLLLPLVKEQLLNPLREKFALLADLVTSDT